MLRSSENMNAIDIKNVNIYYKPRSSVSIKKLFSRDRKQVEMIHAVKDMSFSVKKGEIIGIIGENGSGKSTLLRSIAGVFSPDTGSIDLHGASTSLLSLGVGFKPELTGRENVVLSGLLMGFTLKEVEERMPEILDFTGIGSFIDLPVKTYSSGMYAKLAFSVSSCLETDILLIDEVLSVGDETFRVKSYRRMQDLIKDKNRTVLIVSHNMDLLRELCDRVVWIHRSELKEIGDPGQVLDLYKEFMDNNK